MPQRDRDRAVTSAALRLPARTASVPEARRFVLRCLDTWSLQHLADTVAVLTSEVVTNAVLHARTEIVLRAQQIGGSVEIGVSDLSPVTPVRRQHGSDATTGRGVQLLEQLAERWDVVRDESGKTVRFTVSGGTDPWAAYRDGAWQDAEL